MNYQRGEREKKKVNLIKIRIYIHFIYFSIFNFIIIIIEWAEETPAAASCLRIVYRGRYLEEDKTLECKK